MAKIKQICIDLDNYTTMEKFLKVIDRAIKRCKQFGQIISSKKTKHGWHIKVKLKRAVGFWRSIEIRYYCKDDIKRMFYDIMRHRAGGTIIDVCFDLKTLNMRGSVKKQ